MMVACSADRSIHCFLILILVQSILMLSINYTVISANDVVPAPTNVQITCQSAMLSWDEVDNATSYEVLWRLLDEKSGYKMSTIRNRTRLTLRHLSASSQYSVMVTSTKNRVEGGSSELVFTTDVINLVAPTKLFAKIVSNRMLRVSWNYPSSLREQIIAFEVTYSLVSAYDTVAGVKTFAESDTFNTTENSFHFALVSSVTNYIFTVTPYSATHAGDSARVMVNDFSQVDLVEVDPVIFFNLRITSTSSSFYSDIKKGNSELTREIESSINEICQCTLPSYTIRGSMDLCDSQSNCAIYTGRLLGSDRASASEVFKMVQDYLSMQNGSLLDGTLSVDPTCPLRRLSPSDMACSSITSNSEEDNMSSQKREVIDVIKMVAIGIGSGLAIVICSLISCICVCILHKKITRRKTTSSDTESKVLSYTQSEEGTEQRHYSVVVERNPSYHRHHNKALGPIQKTIFNGGRLEAVSSIETLNSDSPYAYTSLKPASRQADPGVINQLQGTTHLTVEQPTMMPRYSQSSNNEYVISGISSPLAMDDNHNENYNSTFHPTPTSLPNSPGVYLSVS